MLNKPNLLQEVRITRYHYFKNKPEFEKEEDNYASQWGAFAMEKGQFHYEIDKDAGTTEVGDIILCPPHTVFRRMTEEPLTFHFFIFDWIPLSPATIQDYIGPTGKLSFREKERLWNTCNLLRRIAHADDEAAQLWRNHLLTDILRAYIAERSIPAMTTEEDVPTDRMIAEAKLLIDARFRETSMQVQRLAEDYAISPVQFTRRFKQAYGLNPSEYISSLRVIEARRLLTHTDWTIDSVARSSGFNNGFYLSKVFINKLGITPSKFRSRYRV